MISLGFFRILEVELNQRIIRPLAKGLDWTALKLLARPAKAAKEHIIPENVLDKLGRVRAGDASGLELGPLYLLQLALRRSSIPTRTERYCYITPSHMPSPRMEHARIRRGVWRTRSIRWHAANTEIPQHIAAISLSQSRPSASITSKMP
jgi:hypothetical protein